ncbi:hypothetical protein Hamer_G020584 [Homarus americanus]|uniref:Uncharacterized protein n=2 Tax=Homarus americanus TaxID=6706 RepID=A0A8J5K586_HOMAM|nr:hypothetical protein Hamer_G020584 [Homarus americanus]
MDNPDDVGNSRSRRGTSHHWSQPCDKIAHDETNTVESLSTNILTPVSIANSYMQDVKVNYSKVLQNKSWDELANMYQGIGDQELAFLKTKSEAVPGDFNSQLQNSYEKMQRLAVGIEQVTLDQALYQGSFLEHFREIETHIVKILCLLHFAMVHRNLTPSVTINKEDMPQEYRDVEGQSAAREFRDFMILDNYFKSLQNLIQVFTEFENKRGPQ